MRKNYFAILCLAAAAMVGCSKSSESSVSTDSKTLLSIDAMIQTRATELSFESGDKIGVSIEMDADGSSYVSNYGVTYDGSSFASDLAWYSDASATSTLYAYYPYASSIPATFTVATDQTASGAYTASDLMGAIKTGAAPATSTTMTFSHLLSRVVVSVDNQSGLAISSISIGGTIPTASFDMESMSVEVSSTVAATEISIPLWDDATYKAIIVPQTVAPTFTVKFTDGSEVSIAKSSVTFAAGAQYTAELLLTAEPDIEVDLSGDIEDWVDGGTIPDSDSDDSANTSSITYQGQTYATVTLSNGAVWMAEPLCYVPTGLTPSDDAATDSHIWYPYDIDYDQYAADQAAAGSTVTAAPGIDYVKVYTDDESIKAKGYLYDMYAALGGVEVTVDNYTSFEGAQGICPDGWHIPTRADYLALVGYSNKAADEDAALVDTSALIYDTTYNGGTVAGFNEIGLNFIHSGYRMYLGYTSSTTPYYARTMLCSTNTTDESLYGKLALSYYMTSTAYNTSYSSDVLSNIQFFGLMSTFTASAYPEGRLMLAYVSVGSGQHLRCVKDAE
ncbi:MAG: fimbrillin family protein [Rikenellaceae bacterium]